MGLFHFLIISCILEVEIFDFCWILGINVPGWKTGQFFGNGILEVEIFDFCWILGINVPGWKTGQFFGNG